MSLGLPLGLLGLLGVAALIIIYILKPKYADKAVSSTFIWKLTLKYKKKKLPFQWLRSSLLLIIQIMVLTVLAFSLAQPQIVFSAKSGEKIIVLEASANMLTQKNGRTRFDRALADIARFAETTTPKDRISVILAADEATPLVTRSDSASFIKQALSGAVCTYGEADIGKAMTLAETILRENTDAEIILYTGREHPGSGITVKNMSDNEWNTSVLNFQSELSDGYYRFFADAASYNMTSALSVVLEVDGKYEEAKSVLFEADKAQRIVFSVSKDSYNYAKVYISAEDALTYDNEFFLFGGNRQNFKVHLVSKAPLFLSAALRAVPHCDVTVPGFTPEAMELIQAAASETERQELVASFTIDDYMVESTGYDLYVYERMTPAMLPADGAVWFINPDAAPVNSGLSLGARASGSFSVSAGGTGEPHDTVLTDLSISTMTVSEYRRVLMAEDYDEIMSIGGNPVLLTRHKDGMKITLVAFDFHNSNLPITFELPILVSNLCKYSLSRTTDGYIYNVGTKVQINANAAATAVTVEGGGVQQQFTEFPANITVKRNGEYTVKQTFPTRTTEEQFFVRIAETESNFSFVGEAIKKPVTAGVKSDEVYDYVDILLYLSIALLIAISIEWGLQYREQY